MFTYPVYILILYYVAVVFVPLSDKRLALLKLTAYLCTYSLATCLKIENILLSDPDDDRSQ